MREWVKVVLGVLALTIGASAPTLILEALRPGSLVALNVPSPRGGNTQQQHQPDATEEHQRAQSTQQPSENAPPTQDNHSVAPKPEGEGKWYTRPDWWVAGFTAALFIATTGLWIFTALLWLSTRRAVMEGQEAITAAQASADAANAQARAAVEANKINREVLIAIDRPWIAVQMKIPDGEHVIFNSNEFETIIEITARNIGRSPAVEVVYITELCADLVEANRRINSMDLRYVPHSGTGHGRLLIPDESFSEKRHVTASVAEFKKFLKEAASAASAAEAEETRTGEEAGEAELFNEGWPAVIAAVWYRIPADQLPRRTIIVGEIINNAPDKIGFDGSEGTFRDVRIIESPMGNRAT